MRVAKALIYNERGELLVLRRSNTHPHFALEADLPGGIIEDGETFETGLAREIFEETKIVVEPSVLSYAATKKEFVFSEKRLYNVHLDRTPEVELSWEHDSYEWVAVDKLEGRLDSRDSYMTFAKANITS